MAESNYHQASVQHIRRRHQYNSPQPAVLVHQQQSLEHQRLHPQQHQQSLQDLAANLGLCSHHSRRYEINKSY
jgi:hypothetical protein